MAAISVGMIDGQRLLWSFLLHFHLQYSMLLWSLVPWYHIIVGIFHILYYLIYLYTINIVSADLRKVSLLEPLSAESSFGAVMFLELRRTGVWKGNIGRFAWGSIRVFELYLIDGIAEDGGLIWAEGYSLGRWWLAKILIKIEILLVISMLAEIGLTYAAVQLSR